MNRDLTARTAQGIVLRVSLALGIAVAAVAGLPGRAPAQTACGSMITNIATATMWSGAPDFAVFIVSYSVTSQILVLCPPVIALTKSSSINGDPLVQCAAGCLVTFQVCLNNQQFAATDSVWEVTITDRIPTNMAFQAGGAFDYNTTNPSLGAITFGYASGATPPATGWTAAYPPLGQTSTPTTTFIRWVVPGIGPTRSACLTYTARIL